MTGLLVSVRSADEARLALAAGVDVIDIKEPSAGSLGAALPETIAAILSAVNGRCPVSAALGELIEAPLDCVAGLPSGLTFAKLGLSNTASLDWLARWRNLWNRASNGPTAVAVAYADHTLCDAPPPEEVLAAAVQMDCAAILVDTFDKQAGRLLDWWRVEQIEAFLHAAKDRTMPVVLAGSLRLADIEELSPLQPYLFAVRGAACREGRTGPLDAERIRKLVDLVRAVTSPSPP